MDLLGPGGVGPLFVNLGGGPLLSDGGGASTSWNVGDDVRSKDDVAEGDTLTGDTSGWAVDEHSLLVDDLDNSGELTGVSTLSDEDNTAELDKSPVGSLDSGFGHFLLVVSVSVYRDADILVSSLVILCIPGVRWDFSGPTFTRTLFSL